MDDFWTIILKITRKFLSFVRRGDFSILVDVEVGELAAEDVEVFLPGELAVFVFVGTFEGLGVGEFIRVEEAVAIFILGVELLGAVGEEFLWSDDLVTI